jgi:hypothetical protein
MLNTYDNIVYRPQILQIFANEKSALISGISGKQFVISSLEFSDKKLTLPMTTSIFRCISLRFLCGNTLRTLREIDCAFHAKTIKKIKR